MRVMQRIWKMVLMIMMLKFMAVMLGMKFKVMKLLMKMRENQKSGKTYMEG